MLSQQKKCVCVCGVDGRRWWDKHFVMLINIQLGLVFGACQGGLREIRLMGGLKYDIILYQKGEVPSCFSYCCCCSCCVTLRGPPPPWILKRGGVESSGRSLISSIGKAKRIALFFFLPRKKYFQKFQIKKNILFFEIFQICFSGFG